MTLTECDRQDPISSTLIAVDHLKALLDSTHCVTREGADHYGSDPMQTLTDLAQASVPISPPV